MTDKNEFFYKGVIETLKKIAQKHRLIHTPMIIRPCHAHDPKIYLQDQYVDLFHDFDPNFEIEENGRFAKSGFGVIANGKLVFLLTHDSINDINGDISEQEKKDSERWILQFHKDSHAKPLVCTRNDVMYDELEKFCIFMKKLYNPDRELMDFLKSFDR